MNITVYLPTGANVHGIVIPRSAVIWWQGKAWAYFQKDSTTYIRLEISTANPVQAPKGQGGWFVPDTAGEYSESIGVVTKGTQLLLSEEFRSKIQVGEEGDND